MDVNQDLVGQCYPVLGFASSDLNSDATTDRVSMQNAHRATIVFSKAAGTAGDDVSLQLFQADAATSGNTKALTFDHFYHRVGTATTFTRVDLTTASGDVDTVSVNGSTDLAADTVSATFLIDVKADQLDIANGYKYIYFTSPGADVGNATYGSCMIHLYGLRNSNIDHDHTA